MTSPAQLSFLPDDYLARKQQRRTNVICALLFMAVIGGIGSAFTLTERSMRDLERQHADVERQYTDAAKRIEQVRGMQEKQRRMAHQAELTASLLEKVPRSYLLADLIHALPTGVSLIDFTMESKRRNKPLVSAADTAFEAKKTADAGKKKPKAAANALPELPEPKAFDVTMKLTGIAPTDVQVAGFIRQLGESKLFSEVNLMVSDQLKERGDESLTPRRRFVLELVLDPKARVNTTDAQKLTSTSAVELSQ